MARRWIGLKRTHPQRRKRHIVHGLLHSVGAGGMLVLAAVMNFAMYPDALASVVGIERAPLGIVGRESESAMPSTTTLRPVDPAEAHLLAATAWAEARSEGEDGMRAVAHVIVNRVGNRFGDDVQTVILSPKQFSAWNLGDPNRPLAQNPERYARAGSDKATWEQAQAVALQVLSGQSVDPTNGALFYHTRAISPWWSRFGRGRTVIGAHVFYRDVPDQVGIRRFAAVTHAGTRAAAPGQHGPRAGRVNGVIQYAPPPSTTSAPVSAPSAPLPLAPDVST